MSARLNALASILAISAVTFITVNVFAAESVRVTENLENYSTQLTITSSSLNAIELNIDVEAISINPDIDWGSEYQVVGLPEGDRIVAGVVGEVGQPELPVLTTMIAIPDMAGVTVAASYESFEIIEDVDMLPAQVPMPEGGFSEPQPFSMDIQTYSQDRFFPEVLAEAETPVIFRDVRMVQVAIYPVHYNPVTRQLKVYRNVSIDVSFNGEVENPKTVRHNFISESFYPLYKSLIVNFDEYMNTLTSTEVRRGSILIITPNLGGFMWADEIQTLANWKRQKGYDVVVATTHDVDPADGKPTSTQIKSFIQNAYNNWEVPPDYVYLIGDEDISYSGYLMPDYPYSSYASDHQYSRVDGSDFLPDLAVCRASVDNVTQLNTWIAKVLKYDKWPMIDGDPEYWRRAIMVAGGNQTVTCVWTVLWAKERLEQIGFTQIDTVFERNYNDPPDYRITSPITAGVGYVNYRGWATPSGWLDPSYNTSALNQCQNINKPGVMTSIVCGTGDFGSYTDPCFGEMWLRMGSPTAPRGGPSFFGSTDHSTHTRWNNPISFGFYHALINQGIYNFGMAVIAGKMRQYSCFPRDLSEIQKYFHTYNMLGDPELEMRLKIPVVLDVTYPTSVEHGINSIDINVLDNMVPIEGAYVTLILGEGADEVFYYVTKTDASGNARLDVPADTTGELTLTITGRDLYPFIRPVTVGQTDETVALNNYTIDDDQQGNSNGNDDGFAGPTETIEISIELMNFGGVSTAENVTAQLISDDENIAVVHSGEISYGQIAPGQTSTGDEDFIVTINPSALDGETASFSLIATSDSNPDGWISNLSILVAAAAFTVSDVIVSDNGRLDPDETAELTIEITNNGQIDAAGISGVVRTSDGYIHVAETLADFGDIASGETGDNSASLITVAVDAGTFEGRNVPFVLSLTSLDGAVYQANFNLAVGLINGTDPSGPDAYGYYMFDNTDIGYPEAPTYDWMEVNTLGTNLYQSDDTKDLIDLPFEFVYYGQTFDRITVCSNGWICPDSTQWIAFRNWPLPDPAYAQGMIAGFWDDLGPSGSTYNVFTYYDEENHRFIIEWFRVSSRWSYSIRQKFQIVLYDPAIVQTITGDGVIEFIYDDITNGDSGFGENYASVGWESMDELTGFSISYSNLMSSGCATLTDNRTYRITTNTGRGAVAGNVVVANGEASGVKVKASSGQWTTTTNDGLFSLRDVPPGQVDLAFSKDGWFPQTLSDIDILANAFTNDQTGSLEQCSVPSDLSASEGLSDHIQLTWTEVTHDDLAGYDIYRNRWENGIFTKINETPVSGNTYDDYTVEEEVDYYYYVTAVYSGADYDAVSLGSNKDSGSTSGGTDVDDQALVPQVFALSQNYPNPFNAQTVINYSLPVPGQVSLEIFNILGQRIASIIDGYQDAGYKSVVWNGQDESGSTVASGVYFYRLTASSNQITKRMLMLK